MEAVTGQRKPGRLSSVTRNPCVLQRRWLEMAVEHVRVSLTVPDGAGWTIGNGVALPRPASANTHFWVEQVEYCFSSL